MTKLVSYPLLPLSVLVISLLMAAQANAQSHTFVKHFGGAVQDYARSIKASPIGDGYYIGGTTTSFGNYSMLLMKISPDGDSIWSREYGSSIDPSNEAFDLCVQGASHYATGAAGGAGTWDGFIISTNMSGQPNWYRLINDTTDYNDYANCLTTRSKGGIVVAATINNTSDDDILVMAISDVGSVLWSTMISSVAPGQVRPRRILETPEGSIIVGGQVSQDGLIIKLSSAGIVQWAKEIPEIEEVNGLVHNSDGDYVVSGNRWPGYRTIHLVAIDDNGNKVWERSHRDPAPYPVFEATGMIISPDDGLAVCGFSNTSVNNYDALLLKTDHNGNFEWLNRFGGVAHEYAYGIANAVDGSGYVLTGESYSYTNGASDILVIKTDVDGKTGCPIESSFVPVGGDTVTLVDFPYWLSSGYEISPASTYKIEIHQDLNTLCDTTISYVSMEQTLRHLLCYPNPADQLTMLQTKELEGGLLQVYNVRGELCKEQLVSGAWTVLRTADLVDGLYVLRITDDSGRTGTGRAVVQH